MVASLGTAPWGNSAHFGKYSEAADEFFSNFSCEDILFQTLYGRICADWHKGQRPTNFGTTEHMKFMFKLAKRSAVFANKGAKTSLGRWFQWTRRWRDVQQNCGFLLLSFMYIGLHERWWPSMEKSPLRYLCNVGEEACPALEFAPGADDDGGGDGGDVDDDAPGDRGNSARPPQMLGAAGADMAPDSQSVAASSTMGSSVALLRPAAATPARCQKTVGASPDAGSRRSRSW